MASTYGIHIPLWSFAADGGALLERAAGEVSLDHVSVPAVTGPRTALRLAAEPERPYFHTDGGWHYPVSGAAFTAAGVKPTKARWVTTTDHLQRLRARATRLGLDVTLRVDLRGVRALLDGAPHLAQRNAWGQEVPAAGACILNPELRELLRAALADLARYEPRAFELADWSPDHHAGPPTWLAHWDAAAQALLTTCFCPACREAAARAEVDPDAAARSTIEQFRQSAGRHPAPACDPVVTAYRAARHADGRRWLESLAGKLPGGPHYLLETPGDPSQPDVPAPWVRLVRLTRHEPTLRDTDGVRAFIEALGRPRGLALPAGQPVFQDSAALVRTVVGAATAGVDRIDFEGLDEAPEQAVTWLKQAVRFARRDA